ncbi:hypothetical protein PY650_23235 [Rhizobium calliandrae]|uniref:Uncharacterized protein n=1 Tax=Rhizobium calliandrae TaxID=1312182 RepID=A0ABT7KIS8_9HYPH|nr:hypothetical protein [Rhizobium calliandrae]MDL2408505.1 hypothetical protein [Rhizobium calliandrae]
MKDVAEILKAVAWPITTVIVFFYLRHQLTFLVASVIRRISDANKLKFRFLGLTFEMASQLARTSIAPTKKTKTDETDADEFVRLAGEYQDLDIQGTKERVAKRFELADRLGDLAVALNLPRANLAKGNEGYLVAFATAAILQPMPDDLKNLRTAASKVKFKLPPIGWF